MTNLPKLTNLPKFMTKFQEQKLFKDIISKAISAFAKNNDSSAEHWFYPCRARSDQLISFLNSK